MSMAYIREAYGVPAKRGQRVRYFGDGAGLKVGAITSAKGQYLYIRFDGESKRTGPFHPTWKLEYITGDEDLAELVATDKSLQELAREIDEYAGSPAG